MKYPIPESALAQHIAVLGKTGSGKTNTGKTIIEHVVMESDARVCILDPVKSDWWGLISSADGRRPGLPFHILGGPRGHVPVHAAAGKAIAELVAVGTLPLSIIDMSDFAPGGHARFFVDFAPTLMRKMRGVLYLVMEEAHLLAPKERSGVGDENMMIHFAKLLATAGRSKGIRLIVLSQRTQALHNAVLGSCETMIAHRMTAPADQEQVIKWLKANVKDKDLRAEIEDSLSNLRTGTGWVCSGEAGLFKRVEFPKAITFDNTATPDGSTDAIEVRTAAVDREKLRAIVGDAVAEAQANDPAELKKRIKELERQLAAGGSKTDADVIEARRAGEQAGYAQGRLDVALAIESNASAMFDKIVESINYGRQDLQGFIEREKTARAAVQDVRPESPVRSGLTPSRPAVASITTTKESRSYARQIDGRASAGNGAGPDLGAAARKILAVLSQFPEGCTAGKLTLLTRYRYSGGFKNALCELRTHGLMEGENTAVMRITDAGLARGPFPDLPRGQELAEYWLAHPSFGKCAREVLRTLIEEPKGMTAAQLTKATNYEYSGGFKNALAELRTAGVIIGKNTEVMRASEDLLS